MNSSHGVVRVALPCTGLGRQRRGFEAFTRELHGILRVAPGIDCAVYGGGGAMEAGERAVWNAPRDSATAHTLARLTGRGPYFIEQATFFAGFLPYLAAWRPHLVYFADLNFGNACWHWRRLTGQRFRMLFYNGGATTRPFTRCDWVQQLTRDQFDDAVVRGESAERMFVLPHGFRSGPPPVARDMARVSAVRRALGVPDGRAMLLSVGMLDCSIKRMDALVDAVASMDTARPHLVLLGQETPETPALRERVVDRLGDGACVGTWPRERMAEVYEAADAFALLSLREGFGLAYVEALAAGLPCVAHDTPSTRDILGSHALLGDTTVPANTVALLRCALDEATTTPQRLARYRWVSERFGWDALAPRYAEMMRACAAGRRPSWSDA
jgi:glycosyltransferase involved in cell wall biosynthesis